jgi:hypothetical protein
LVVVNGSYTLAGNLHQADSANLPVACRHVGSTAPEDARHVDRNLFSIQRNAIGS